MQPITSTYTDPSLEGAANAYWQIPKWSIGVTEPGSSGSPLFNTEHKVIGTLTGGASACDSLTGSDYYAKFSEYYKHYTDSSQQLKYWLDPLNSGVTSLNGFSPFSTLFSNCDTLTNILSGESTVVLPYASGNGYYSGTNSDSITTYAEKFTNSDSIYLTGVNMHIGSIGSTGGLIVQVYDGNTVPSNVLYETYVSYSKLKANSYNYVEFYPYLKLKGNFFIAYTIPYNGTDTFTIYQASPRYKDTEIYNTEYILYRNFWVPFNLLFVTNTGSSLDIRPTICKTTITDIKPLNTFLKLEVYPCPANNYIKLKTPGFIGKSNFEIFDIYGRLVYSANNYIQNSEINITNLSEGVYFIKNYQSGKGYSAKFIKIK